MEMVHKDGKGIGDDKEYKQIYIENIKLNVGDKLFKGDILYAEVVQESETLYFLQNTKHSDSLPNPRFKDRLIKEILYGNLRVEKIRFE